MAEDALEELGEESGLDKKARKKAERARKKEEKKQKKEEKKQAKGEEAEEEEEGGSKLAVVLATIVFIAIWLAILALIVKMDIGGFGSTVLQPILKDVPVINKILPETEEEPVVDAQYPYTTLDEAINRIKELELELSDAQSQSQGSSDSVAQLEAEVARLREFENEQSAFEEEKTKFYKEVVFNENAPDISEYRAYYESIDPANAEVLYKQVVQQQGDGPVLLHEFLNQEAHDDRRHEVGQVGRGLHRPLVLLAAQQAQQTGEQDGHDESHGTFQQCDDHRIEDRPWKIRTAEELHEIGHPHPGALEIPLVYVIILESHDDTEHGDIMEHQGIEENRDKHQVHAPVHL